MLQTAVHIAQARADDHAIMGLSKDSPGFTDYMSLLRFLEPRAIQVGCLSQGFWLLKRGVQMARIIIGHLKAPAR